MKNKLIIANMKMYMDYKDIYNYIREIENITYENIIFLPSAIFIPYFLNKNYKVGIQNIHYEQKGAHTGDICPEQIKMMINYALVGHSERRQKETDEIINKKIKSLLDNNMTPILCVGENENEDFKKVVKKELTKDLDNIENIENIIIAYEPIWSIGTNKIPTNEQIEHNIKYIKQLIHQKYNSEVKVLYGGSVNSENIELLMQNESVDGFLIGSASTKVNELKKIIEVALK